MTTTAEREQRTTEEELVRQARLKDLRTRWFWRIAGYVVFIGRWEFVSGRVLEEALLPGPIRVIQTLGDLWGDERVIPAFQATLGRLFLGFGLSFIIGTIPLLLPLVPLM